MKSFARFFVLLLTLLPVSAQAASRWQGFAVWPSTDHQGMPAVSGTVIVWQQFLAEYGDYDICIADINDPADPFVLFIGDENDQTNPDVSGNIVVWQDFVVAGGSADWDISMADISEPAVPQLFAVSQVQFNDEQRPAIHGNIVLWQDGAAGNLDVRGADITDAEYPSEFVVADFEFDQEAPAIYRDTVVWQDEFFGDWDIYAADIWRRNRPSESGVSLVEGNQINPAIWGEMVVWQDDFFGDWDIYAADLSTSLDAGISEPDNPVEFALTTNESSQTNPDIDGNIVVWQDYRTGNWDIFGYNLTTHREFQITDEPHDQTNPAISGNIVVWQDNGGDSPQIYAAFLDGPEVAKCPSRMDGDVNGDCRIDFADFVIMASRWLECDLEPVEACWPN